MLFRMSFRLRLMTVSLLVRWICLHHERRELRNVPNINQKWKGGTNAVRIYSPPDSKTATGSQRCSSSTVFESNGGGLVEHLAVMPIALSPLILHTTALLTKTALGL